MSRQALIISVLLALALGMIALAVLFRPSSAGGSGGAPAALLALDPGAVRSLRIERPGAVAERIERVSGGGWRLVAERPGATPWPLVPSHVRGLLAVLAEVAPQGEVRTGVALPDDALAVTITTEDGGATLLRLDGRSVGGRSLAEVDGSTVAFITDEIYKAFTQPGPRAWRDTSAMPGVGADVSRLSAVTPELDLSLARIGSRWYLRTPVSARADEAAAKTLLNAMTGLAVARFIDDPSTLAPGSTGLDDPQLILAAEIDRRTIDVSGSPRVVTERRELRIGGPANMAGDELYATPDGGETVLVVGVGSLGAVSSDPAFYTSRTATGVAPADVGMVIISPEGAPDFGFRRSVAGEWSRLVPDGSQIADDGADVTELLGFLSSRGAGSVSFDEPEGYDRRGAVTLLDFEGEALERIEYGVAGAGELTLRSPAHGPGVDAPAFRGYPNTAAPRLLGLAPAGAAVGSGG